MDCNDVQPSKAHSPIFFMLLPCRICTVSNVLDSEYSPSVMVSVVLDVESSNTKCRSTFSFELAFDSCCGLILLLLLLLLMMLNDSGSPGNLMMNGAFCLL